MSFTSRRLSEERSLFGSKKGLQKPSPAVPAVRVARGWWGWYARWKAHRAEKERAGRLARLLRVLALVTVACLLGLLLLAGTVKALIAMRVLTPQRILSLAGADLPTDANGFTNFLLLGTGDADHDGVDLTDTIMVASVDARKTKSVVLLSIPRDLYMMKTKRMGVGRVNQLYLNYKWSRIRQGATKAAASQEALRELAQEIGSKLGVDIHHVAKVDFTAFIQTVDAVGGIDVLVPEDLVDTEYPGPNYSYETFSVKAGQQHMDGETALKYARSRHSTSDFDRSARQQLILKALGEKATQAGIATSPGKISALFTILSENVETTMNFGEILGAGKLAELLERQHVLSYNIDLRTDIPGGFLYPPDRNLFNGASVLLPLNLGNEPMGSWRQLQVFMQVLLTSRAMLLEPPRLVVRNAGARTGLARILAGELTRFGFPPEEVGNLSAIARDESLDRETSAVAWKTPADKAAAEYFGALLRLPVEAAPAPSVPPALSDSSSSGAWVDPVLSRYGQVTILLGKDYTFETMQELITLEKPAAGSGSLLSAGFSSDARFSPVARSSSSQ